MECCQRGLGIKIDGLHAVAGKRKPLSKVGEGCRLARVALEVHHAADLQVIAVAVPEQVVAGLPRCFSSKTRKSWISWTE